MSFLNSVLKAFVGDKRKKDLKLLQPMVDKVRSFDKSMEALTIEELRDARKQAGAPEPYNPPPEAYHPSDYRAYRSVR